MAVKYFCDMCGKEVEMPEMLYAIYSKPGISSIGYGCKECHNRIQNVMIDACESEIEKIKKEVTK